MPHVVVKLYPGRSEQQKASLTEAITQAVIAHIGSKDASISIGIEEIAPEHWGEQVYEPDIQAKWGTLTKKPGYTPA